MTTEIRRDFHFVVLQTGRATPAGGADRAYEAGWGDGGVGLAGGTAVREAGPRARETGALVTCGNRPRAKNGDMRKPPASETSETGVVDARDMEKPPASETGAVDPRDMRTVEHAETARERDWRGGRL